MLHFHYFATTDAALQMRRIQRDWSCSFMQLQLLRELSICIPSVCLEQVALGDVECDNLRYRVL